ncbi:hypothetical protein MTO96_020677 [Rhipicephalus appendiculatus]
MAAVISERTRSLRGVTDLLARTHWDVEGCSRSALAITIPPRCEGIRGCVQSGGRKCEHTGPGSSKHCHAFHSRTRSANVDNFNDLQPLG